MAEKQDPRQLLRYSAIGIEFIAVFGLGLAGGLYVDRHSGGGVLYTLLGAASGFVAGLYLVFRTAREYRQSLERKDS
jgi:F0F1-type ATP synthase assembly protein I